MLDSLFHNLSPGPLWSDSGSGSLYFVLFLCDTYTHLWPFSGTIQVSRYQKGKINLDFTETRDSEWQWHQLGHMQVCTLLQTTTPPPHHSVFYRPDALPVAHQQRQSTEGFIFV